MLPWRLWAPFSWSLSLLTRATFLHRQCRCCRQLENHIPERLPWAGRVASQSPSASPSSVTVYFPWFSSCVLGCLDNTAVLSASQTIHVAFSSRPFCSCSHSNEHRVTCSPGDPGPERVLPRVLAYSATLQLSVRGPGWQQILSLSLISLISACCLATTLGHSACKFFPCSLGPGLNSDMELLSLRSTDHTPGLRWLSKCLLCV